jgi:hypothetical protein
LTIFFNAFGFLNQLTWIVVFWRANGVSIFLLYLIAYVY